MMTFLPKKKINDDGLRAIQLVDPVRTGTGSDDGWDPRHGRCG